MEKILIIRLSSLGDIVLTQPVTKALREKYPNSTIDFLTKPAYEDVIKAFSSIDNIYLWQNKKQVLKKLKDRKYDLVIDLHSKLNTLIIKTFLSVSNTLTYKKHHFKRWLITKKIGNKPMKPTVSLYLSALIKLGIESDNIIPELYPKDDGFPDFEDIKGIKKIGLFPGALHNTKQYPIEKFAEVINKTPIEWNCKYFIFGSGNENELAENLISLTNNSVQNECGKFGIKELITIISKMDLIISNDSGPMHIAAALALPQIAIFGATHPILGFAPQNQKAIVLSANIKCQPCSLHGSEKCKKADFKCMQEIDSDDILRNISKLLQI